MTPERQEHEHEPSREPVERTPVAERAVQRAHGGRAKRVLAMQRTVGNRAVSGAIARDAFGSPTRTLARKPIQIFQVWQEQRTAGLGVYQGVASFQFEFVANECVLTIKVRVTPGKHVTAAEVSQVQTDTEAAFLRLWDEKFYFDDAKSLERFFLRVKVEWVKKGQHISILLLKGKGRDDQKKWFTQSLPEDRAHEMSHTLGLRDEYIDTTAVNRRKATSKGVFQDHSIMGDYYTEGVGLAEVKLRHGQALANRIGKASKRKLTAGYTGTYQGERLVRWRGIRDTAKTAGNAAAEAAASAEIAAIESDMMIPALLTP